MVICIYIMVIGRRTVPSARWPWARSDQWPLSDIIGTQERFCHIYLLDLTMFFVPATCILKKQQRVESMFYVWVAWWFRGEIDPKKLRWMVESLIVKNVVPAKTHKTWWYTHSSNIPQKTGCAPVPVKTTKIGCVPVPVKTHKSWL
jgi:hypothetical protein